MELVIVESPNKCAKIKKILGDGYQVQASVGHIADLPKKEIGVNTPNFEPDFQLTERGKKTASQLKEYAKKASMVWLATDPDREGEAIASHLAHFLKLKNPKRIVFNEITDRAVKAALNNAGEVDQNLYAAQKARRVVDRLVGYKVSPKLSQIANQALSAGRVQSVALRLIVDRERMIRNFKSTEHFGVKLLLNSHGINWVAKWDTTPYVDADNPYVLEKSLAQEIASTKEILVQEVSKKTQKKNAPPPFITTTLQRAANIELGLNASESMQAAQKLFEEGVISYHRTDNPNLSDEAMPMLLSSLVNMGYEDDIPEKKNTFKSKEGAQEAHEAIRPTDFSKDEINLGETENKIYQLIRVRALASQLKPAEVQHMKIICEGQSKIQEKSPIFIAKSSEILYDGWMKLTAKDQSEEVASEEEDGGQLPAVTEGDQSEVKNSNILELKTKPPSRYSEPALISKLEKGGIGRPATYASILANIKGREYIKVEKKVFVPQASAELIVDALKGHFSFLEIEYTKNMESNLDEVACGNKTYLEVVTEANDELEDNLKELSKQLPSFPCPACESDMRKLKSKDSGFFWGCSTYPECKTTLPDDNGKPGEKVTPLDSEFSCPKCDKPLRRIKNKKGKYFFGCSGYSDGCKYLVDDNKGKPAETFDCPKCNTNHLVKRKGSKGLFFGCSGYPECRATFENKRGKPDFSKKVGG